MKIHVKHGDNELTFASWAEFQAMWKHKMIAPDDLVRRGDASARWTRAADLPELRNMASANKEDDRRLFFITLALMALALIGALLVRAYFRHH